MIPDLVTLDGCLVGCWLGSSRAKTVVVHFHGGGFSMDITSQHFELWHRLMNEASKSGIELSVFFPVYSLTPHSSYPTQIEDAKDALDYILNDSGRDPQDIILSGDSAGATLCLSLILRWSRSTRDQPSPRHRFRGMILICPWTSFGTDWQSITQNCKKDIDTAMVLRKWAQYYLNGRPSDGYSEPLLAPPDWWINACVDRTLVTAGSDEMLLDSIQAWADVFQTAGNETDLYIGNGEFHIEPLVGPILGFGDKTETERYIGTWLRILLG